MARIAHCSGLSRVTYLSRPNPGTPRSRRIAAKGDEMTAAMTQLVRFGLTALAAAGLHACGGDSAAEGTLAASNASGSGGAKASASPAPAVSQGAAGNAQAASRSGMSATAGQAGSATAGSPSASAIAAASGASQMAGVMASGAGAPAQGVAGSAGVSSAPACNPADKTPPAKIIQYSGKDSPLWENGAKWYEPDAVTDTDTPNTGPYKITIEVDPTAETFTIYRPELKERLLPIVAYANGGCFQDGTFTGEFLKEIATYGFLVIADGPPGGSETSPSDGTRQKAMIDWALKENERACSTYYHTLDTQKVAVTGGSCGGLMTFNAAPDPRVTTAVLWNSGLFDRDQTLYDSLHAPMAIFDGGSEDPAYENAKADVAAITKVPVFFANDKRGHAGYQWDDNGGEAAKVGVAWFNWQLLGDMGATGKGMFVGPDCGMCKLKDVWTDLSWKNGP
jgi:hypothetical protein